MTAASASPAVTVLLSGGIDSAACVRFYIGQGFCVQGMFIDYGQPAATHEAEAARAVSRHFGIALQPITLSEASDKPVGLVRARNAFLVLTAVMESPDPLIAIGIHAGTPYWDCSRQFVKHMQAILDGYADGRVRLLAPFVDWTKRDVWDFCLKTGIPLQLTYSCETGAEQPCGECRSCRDLEALRGG